MLLYIWHISQSPTHTTRKSTQFIFVLQVKHVTIIKSLRLPHFIWVYFFTNFLFNINVSPISTSILDDCQLKKYRCYNPEHGSTKSLLIQDRKEGFAHRCCRESWCKVTSQWTQGQLAFQAVKAKGATVRYKAWIKDTSSIREECCF